MNNHEFESQLAYIMNDFINQKQLLGYPYKHSGHILKKFDDMIKKHFPNETTITKSICDKWIEFNSHLHQNTLVRNITPVRQLAKYMNALGTTAYIIPNYIGCRQVKYQAHIYTMQEKTAFFNCVDHLSFSPKSPFRHIIAPVIFRTMYCCGLRESEVLRILTDDINLDTGKIIIRESKGWKSRCVYMSADLLSLCAEYNSKMTKILPCRTAFFPNKDGNIMSYGALNKWFHLVWDSLPFVKTVEGARARLHDFRHTYAVDRLNSWVREKEDINALYMYLSEYMGHVNFNSTDYYLQLVADFYPELEKRLEELNKDILPEVSFHE